MAEPSTKILLGPTNELHAGMHGSLAEYPPSDTNM